MTAFMSNGSGGVTVCRPEEAADIMARLRAKGHAVRVETPERDVVQLYWGTMAPKSQPPTDQFYKILADIEAGVYGRTA